MITHRCKACAAPVEVSLVDISTIADLARSQHTYVWGPHGHCERCGSTNSPELVIDDTHLLTQPISIDGPLQQAIKRELRMLGYTPGTPEWDGAMAAAGSYARLTGRES